MSKKPKTHNEDGSINPEGVADALVELGMPESVRTAVEKMTAVHDDLLKVVDWENGATDDLDQVAESLEAEALAHATAMMVKDALDPIEVFKTAFLCGLYAAHTAPTGWVLSTADGLAAKNYTDDTRKVLVEAGARVRAGYALSNAALKAAMDQVIGEPRGPLS